MLPCDGAGEGVLFNLSNSHHRAAEISSEHEWTRAPVSPSAAVITRASKLAIIGAGPYGLSIAAHLRARGVEFRIFGSPMHSWRMRMPMGMFLKSEGFASSLHDPVGRFTLQRFCAERGLRYAATDLPVPLDTFTEYGLEFQREIVPNVEEKTVVALDRSSKGFLLRLDNGEIVAADRVIVAVGITYFSHVPAGLAHLPADAFSHTSDHHDLSHFKGADVTVIGGGASALDVAASLHDIGVEVRLIARQSSLRFNIPQTPPLWKRWQPISGLGGGWRNQFFERGPMLFRRLPQGLRSWIVSTASGPAGGFPVKERIERVPVLLGHTIRYARFRDNRVHLRLLCPSGEERTISTNHIIAGTGYRVDLRKLTFLSKEVQSGLRSVNFVPTLSAEFQSSIPGLYFVGLASANTFGPVMRFLVGASYTARRLIKHLSKSA